MIFSPYFNNIINVKIQSSIHFIFKYVTHKHQMPEIIKYKKRTIVELEDMLVSYLS